MAAVQGQCVPRHGGGQARPPLTPAPVASGSALMRSGKALCPLAVTFSHSRDLGMALRHWARLSAARPVLPSHGWTACSCRRGVGGQGRGVGASLPFLPSLCVLTLAQRAELGRGTQPFLRQRPAAQPWAEAGRATLTHGALRDSSLGGHGGRQARSSQRGPTDLRVDRTRRRLSLSQGVCSPGKALFPCRSAGLGPVGAREGWGSGWRERAVWPLLSLATTPGLSSLHFPWAGGGPRKPSVGLSEISA